MRLLILVLLAVIPVLTLPGCKVAPKADDRATFVQESRDGLAYFESNVPGLTKQIAASAGYAVFPGAGQWGIIFTGGTFGRGAVFTADGTQVGWAAVNNFNVGLQAGGQGKKILLVFQNKEVMQKFQDGLLTGSAQGTAVAGSSSSNAVAPFQNGMAVYVGAEKGLMAGGMIGMENFRYRALGKEDQKK